MSRIPLVLKNYLNDAELVVRKDLEHVAILFNGVIYDSEGIIENKDNFIKIDYHDALSDLYGREVKFSDLNPNEAVINELESCSGNYVKTLVNNINQKVAC